MWEQLLAQILSQVFVAKLLGVLLLVLLDLAFGVLQAVREGKFEWEKLGQFYLTSILPFVGGWMVLHVAVQVIDVLALRDIAPIVGPAMSTGAYAILMIALAAGLGNKIKAVFGMIPGQK